MAAVYCLGDISAHFNPAMTLAFTLRGDMGWPMAAAYILVQFIAAAAGSVVASWLFGFGGLIFGLSLYIMAMTGVRALGAVTPIGGVLLMAGWAVLIYGALAGAMAGTDLAQARRRGPARDREPWQEGRDADEPHRAVDAQLVAHPETGSHVPDAALLERLESALAPLTTPARVSGLETV